MSVSSNNATRSIGFKISALELEAALFDAIHDNDAQRAQKYLNYMQKNLIGSKKSNKRKIYQNILSKCKLLAIHYKRDEILTKIARMPAKGSRVISRGKKTKVLNQFKLFRAVRKNNTREVETILNQIPKVNRDEMLSKGLGLACYFGHKNLMVKFLEKGADINHDNGDALNWIAREGRIDIIKSLVEKHGVDITTKDNNSLMAAIIGVADGGENNIKTVKYLIDIGADIHAGNEQALITAIDIGKDDIVSLLLEKGADMDVAFAKVREDIAQDLELPELKTKFDKWWGVYQDMNRDLFNKYFKDKDYTLEDLREVIDKKRGITALGVAVKAGMLDEVLQRLNKKQEKLSVEDVRNMAGHKISGVALFANREKLSDIFNASLWSHSPDSIKELWYDLPQNEQKQVNLKQLFSQAKSISLRHYIKDKHRSKGPKR